MVDEVSRHLGTISLSNLLDSSLGTIHWKFHQSREIRNVGSFRLTIPFARMSPF